MSQATAMFSTSTGPAQVHETHTGLVLLYGERAYKVKKPITTDFLDFGTPALRERACARELELNRRMAPDVYLGVAHLTDPEGGVAEPVLVMRRMPEDRRLSNILTDVAAHERELTPLVELLVRFHRLAGRGPEVDRAGTAGALRERWQTLLHPLREEPAVAAHLPERIDHLATRYIDGRIPLFDNRIAEARIVDGHGDLLAQDIFALPDGFRVLDCLDFDDRLRHLDCLDDIAFLAMDFEFLGYPELGVRLLDDYLRATGDSAPMSLRSHYIAYRATVRGKVDLIRLRQGDDDAREHADRHLRIALEHLERAAVRLALVGGLPGTGKSTVARRLAAATGATMLSTDRIRTELAAARILTGESGDFGAGKYSPANKARVYNELLDRARALLASGVSVILDASWVDEGERRRAAELAEQTRSDLVQLRCTCPRELAAGRLRERPSGDSEATPAIAEAMVATAAPWSGTTDLDTATPIDDTVAVAHRAWSAHPRADADVLS
ncbi:AAA family ATPase [Nocardia sp. NPDC050793]|uniref:bifunctional aminoglycoside phosphotransferase/ATP-binding protein n=1 Tax=Nocardia sp. NPDC050793 TaxID=3155159 RepID=UPI0033FAD330